MCPSSQEGTGVMGSISWHSLWVAQGTLFLFRLPLITLVAVAQQNPGLPKLGESWAWHIPAIPALGRLRQSEASLFYIARLCLKKKKKLHE
jgi:hypothetical protein